jgi:membrane fusion protein (multidrug efflux system)
MVETTHEEAKDEPKQNLDGSKDEKGHHKEADKKNSPESKRARKKRQHLLIGLAIIFLIIGLLWLIYWLIWARFEEYTDDAYVNGNQVRLMPQVSGTITAIYTDDTQYVAEGQTVIQLDNADTFIALERAKANLADTVRDVRQLFDNVIQAQQMANLRQADLLKASLDLKRREGLIGEKAISREELQHYLTSYQAAQAQFNYAKSQFNTAFAQIENTTLYTHPKVLRSKVNVKNAYLNFQRTTILAPASGYVAKRSAQVGEQVTPGTSLLAIVPLNQVWVDANYKETQLMRLRIGQPVTVTVDAYNGLAFHGRVHGLSAGTGSAFDLLPPQNATGNWIKIVQRLPVKIDLDPEELKKHPLHIGLSVRTTAKTYKLDAKILDETPSDKAYFATDVYKRQLADADEMINQIISANSADMSLPNEKFMTY